jgi:hypothetical protein
MSLSLEISVARHQGRCSGPATDEQTERGREIGRRGGGRGGGEERLLEEEENGKDDTGMNEKRRGNLWESSEKEV